MDKKKKMSALNNRDTHKKIWPEEKFPHLGGGGNLKVRRQLSTLEKYLGILYVS